LKKRIILILLIFILSISFVSASENTTDLLVGDLDDVEVSNPENKDLLQNNEKYRDIYVNSSKCVEGDGLSPETAYSDLNSNIYDILEDNGTIHLAEGSYNILDQKGNYNIIGMGEDTVINSCWFQTGTTINDNNLITFVNLTFDVPLKRDVHQTIWIVPQVSFEEVSEYYSISLEGTNFRFINCTFINSSIVAGQYMNSINYGNSIMESTIKMFENCKFLNYSYNSTVKEYYKKIGLDSIHCTEFEAANMITSFQYTRFIFNNCIFDDITAESIADSRGGLMGTNQIHGGVIISNSSFSKCNVKGIVKAQQVIECEINDCTYDFDATNSIMGESPYYINKTDIQLNETKFDIIINDDEVIITLIDVNVNKPVKNVEIGVFNNNKVFGYFDTDSYGQIILKDLEGNYNFEFSYPGDPYAYLPTSLNKTFNFTKSQNANQSNSSGSTNTVNAPASTVKKVSKITAKKATFKKSKKVKKYTITLKSGKSPIKKVKVFLKVKGKTYKATTNSKGKATFKITKLTKKGTFKAKITFKGNGYYKAVGKSVNIKVK